MSENYYWQAIALHLKLNAIAVSVFLLQFYILCVIHNFNPTMSELAIIDISIS